MLFRSFRQALLKLDAADEQRLPSLRAKLQAVERLLAELERRLNAANASGLHGTASSTTVAGEGQSGRQRRDVERVTAGHGDRCKAALGIARTLPVEFDMGDDVAAMSNAWLYFVPPASGHYRITTDSTGLDPAIEILAGCGNESSLLVSNDDAIGLDASSVVSATRGKALFIHVSNSLGRGPLTVAVEDANGLVKGTVTDKKTGLPIAGADVALFNIYGGYSGSNTESDADGHFTIQTVNGNFLVRAHVGTYQDTLYPDVPCAYSPSLYQIGTCDGNAAQEITVADDTVQTGIDIAMTAGSRVAGSVRDTFNQPLYAQITLYTSAGLSLATIPTDAFGRYSISPLLAGSYKLSATSPGHASQMFDQVACAGSLQQNCDVSKAGTVVVGAHDVLGVDFDLLQLGTVQGTVTTADQRSMNGFQISLLDHSGNPLLSTYNYNSNQYTIGPLGPGTYYVYAGASGYYSRLFDGIDCAANCAAQIGNATPVTINQPAEMAHADFLLDPLPNVQGHVQEASSGLPLAGTGIYFSHTPPASFQTVATATTDAAGNYSLNTILPGSYYVWAQSSDHVDAVYPDIACEETIYYYQQQACDVTGAVLLTIAPGQAPPAFDFQLTASSRIGGSALTRIEPGSGVAAAVEVDIYDGAGVVVGSANTDLQGGYVVGDLAEGTYYAAAAANGSASSYVPQIWNDLDCPDNCAPTTGSAIAVPAAGTVGNVDFNLLRRGAIVGRVTDTLGAPISGVLIDLFDAATGVYSASDVSDDAGYYVVASGAGSTCFVATEAGGGFIDQVYQGIVCSSGSAYFGLCPLTYATPVAVNYTPIAPVPIDFHLQVNDVVFAAGFE